MLSPINHFFFSARNGRCGEENGYLQWNILSAVGRGDQEQEWGSQGRDGLTLNGREKKFSPKRWCSSGLGRPAGFTEKWRRDPEKNSVQADLQRWEREQSIQNLAECFVFLEPSFSTYSGIKTAQNASQKGIDRDPGSEGQVQPVGLEARIYHLSSNLVILLSLPWFEKHCDMKVGERTWETVWFSWNMGLREIQKDLVKTFQLFLEAVLRSFELILEAMRTSLAVKSRGYNHGTETFPAPGLWCSAWNWEKFE